ncbi:MAG: YgaP-like transmembrane domain [Verrucomicrobiota bacterium]
MHPFFSRNIGTGGRFMRGLGGLALLAIAFQCHPAWLSGTITGAGVFLAFEALLGWCVLRACRIKTPL